MNVFENAVDKIHQRVLLCYGYLNRMLEEKVFQKVLSERNKRGNPRKSWGK